MLKTQRINDLRINVAEYETRRASLTKEIEEVLKVWEDVTSEIDPRHHFEVMRSCKSDNSYYLSTANCQLSVWHRDVDDVDDAYDNSLYLSYSSLTNNELEMLLCNILTTMDSVTFD